jgi:nifR3 family TIM-barrel protein
MNETKPTKLDWQAMGRPILALSPMADMTDSVFCRVVKQFAEPIVFREMVSAEATIRRNDKALEMSDIHPAERPLVQQLFGSDPDTMAEAAAIIEEEHGPEGFDINMGCPVYRHVCDFNGAALMKEPERASEIVRKMKATVSVPVSVKIRAGWEEPEECLEFAPRMEEAGADLITVHGRTRKQGYAGSSDWNLIGEMNKRVSVPVLANGDIHTAPLFFEALETTQCDGVLIARGALGNPWVFKQINDMLDGRMPYVVPLNERIETMRQHLRWQCEKDGQDIGVSAFKKHAMWYTKGLPGSSDFRAGLNTAKTLESVEAVIDEMEASATEMSPEVLSNVGAASLN